MDQKYENNSDSSYQSFSKINKKDPQNNILDNAELALQFTNLLNNSEKLNFENSELKLKNKELTNKVSIQEKAIRELALLLNSIGKINMSLSELQNWLSTETSKRKSLLPNIIEQNQAEQATPDYVRKILLSFNIVFI
jgi:hypothetical protein